MATPAIVEARHHFLYSQSLVDAHLYADIFRMTDATAGGCLIIIMAHEALSHGRHGLQLGRFTVTDGAVTARAAISEEILMPDFNIKLRNNFRHLFSMTFQTGMVIDLGLRFS